MKEQLQAMLRSYFSGLDFVEEEHKYHYKDRSLQSVSKLIDSFVEKVDFHAIAYAVAAREGVPVETIREQWKHKNTTAIVKGHKTHAYAEVLELTPPKTCYEKAILNFWEVVPQRYIRVDRELRMFHKEHFFSGTTDFVLYDTWTNTFVLGDYKTNGDLFKNYRGKVLKYPFHNLLDANYNKYQIQLSFYQILIEQVGIPVSERWLIWIKPEENDKSDWVRYNTNDYTRELKGWLTDKTFYA